MSENPKCVGEDLSKKDFEAYKTKGEQNDEPTLCGFVWCHGVRDFSCFELDSLSDEDRYAIEEILAKYDTHGTSLRNCYDSKFSDALCEIY